MLRYVWMNEKNLTKGPFFIIIYLSDIYLKDIIGRCVMGEEQFYTVPI